MINRIAHFSQSEVMKHIEPIVVETSQIIRLLHVIHHHIKMLAVLFLGLVQWDFICNEFLNSSSAEFRHKLWVLEGIV